ncbi:MAG: hypothetical protein F4X81_02890 [Gammaproteobacteria bacterium]|nr:hypothetical protein [Gammaproteobacteria bacterium]MYF50153.1 hypothetical protein [Gammaproteobacteria bacterium]MYK83778.1 hypothetical protein [Gammaproteobacteria bacterium]
MKWLTLTTRACEEGLIVHRNSSLGTIEAVPEGNSLYGGDSSNTRRTTPTALGTSSGWVAHEQTLIRIARLPRQSVPPNQAVPSARM